MKYFHFTIGPVQSFVAQARRTRDFWAGSFLLSWLAGVAMLSVTKQGGTIKFPTVDKDYLAWIKGNGSGDKPRQGSIPNRFKAEVNENFDAQIIVDNVNKAWCELAEEVWKNDLENTGSKTRAIWDRQINNFWEISWVLTEYETASDLLDRRKNWRNYFAPNEPGIKCMMMSGWQELSGVLKPDSEKIEKFWQPIREKTGLDLREGEHLCAIAFVKRRFARHFHKLNKLDDSKAEKSCNRYKEQIPDDKNIIQAMGWEVKNKIPSVSYMAVVRWLEKVIQIEDKEKLYSFIEVAKKAIEKGIVERGEWYTNIHCIKLAADNELQDLISLDGQVFFVNELQNYVNKLQSNNAKLEKEKSPQPAIDELAYKKINTLNSMIDKLNSIIDIVKEPPSPFYAILMMDGDSLGSKMGKETNQKNISEALKKFTKLVSTIVSKNSGFLIYAGGDDVLAVLPVEDVFNCAIQIREHYQKYFQATNNKEIENSTISAAVEFAHIKTPLTKMLRDAHRLLDNVAKDGCGRDSVAVRVWKQGGTTVKWAMPWKCALNGDKLILEEIADRFRDYDEKESGFTNNFFYKIRERFKFLNPLKDEKPILDEPQQLALLATDYVNAGNNKELNLEKAKEEIEPLLNQCRRYKRDVDEPDIKKWQDENRKIDVDGALLIRFLVNKGVEKNG